MMIDESQNMLQMRQCGHRYCRLHTVPDAAFFVKSEMRSLNLGTAAIALSKGKYSVTRVLRTS